ncbi:hypothetical protein BCR32DRAFT_329307 [Anaeromyces robustus]|uniref:Uncharacterized protein n=1 Tax=Anaeromyces robustus TaxID=1754192 RepID=A0A1Y1WSP3_9FUNG|nr:hypothetical protein BCR32DRAFT_329307 [Anaeromyces robustus]|eukprot:ORX76559.1 hypothetical protein BCR32DRAFT_329307 [Anaeromyces robustus]
MKGIIYLFLLIISLIASVECGYYETRCFLRVGECGCFMDMQGADQCSCYMHGTWYKPKEYLIVDEKSKLGHMRRYCCNPKNHESTSAILGCQEWIPGP